MSTAKWIMTAEVAMEFFKRCYEQKANTEVARTRILIDLAGEGKMTSVSLTNKNKEEAIKDVAKAYGKVLHIKNKRRTSK